MWREDRRKVWDRAFSAARDYRPWKYHRLPVAQQEALAAAIPNLKRRLEGCGQALTGAISLAVSRLGSMVVAGCKTCRCPGCPACAARAEAERSEELREAMHILSDRGTLKQYRVFHVVLTCAHRREEDQVALLRGFVSAFARFRRSRQYRALAGAAWMIEVTGSIFEGAGLHPHAHLLVLIAVDADHLAIATQLREAFYAALRAEEMRACWANPDPLALTGWWTIASDVNAAGDYIARPTTWGAAEELSCSSAKNSGRLVNRRVEDIALIVWALHGQRLHGQSGIFREAIAEARRRIDARKKAPEHLTRLSAATWKALGAAQDELRNRAEALVEKGVPFPVIRAALERLVAELLDASEPLRRPPAWSA